MGIHSLAHTIQFECSYTPIIIYIFSFISFLTPSPDHAAEENAKDEEHTRKHEYSGNRTESLTALNGGGDMNGETLT